MRGCLDPAIQHESTMINDTRERYGVISRIFHWLMAVLIGLQILKLSERLGEGEHWIGQNIVPWHVSIGALLLLLVMLRLSWALIQGDRRPEQTGSTAMWARLVHFLLYAGMVLLPLTGIARLLGLGYGLKAFGLQLIAASGAKTPVLISFSQLHAPISWIFITLIVGHVGAALFRHLVCRDGTLYRMAGSSGQLDTISNGTTGAGDGLTSTK